MINIKIVIFLKKLLKIKNDFKYKSPNKRF